LASRPTRTCSGIPAVFQLANQGTDTRTLQGYLGHRNIQHTVRAPTRAPCRRTLGHRNIQHTVRYTELSPTRFKNLWRD
jgi:site-specific recombinase XerD